MNKQVPLRAQRDRVGLDMISRYADALARSLDEEMRKAYQPTEHKTLRRFNVSEVAELTGISPSNFRARHKDGSFPDVETDSRGHRTYSAEEIDQIDYGRDYDPYQLARLWMARNDARNYALLGDPAARLPFHA